MGIIVKMPMINANDELVDLVRWFIDDGAPIKKGEPICAIETTKSIVDVLADEEGFLRRIAEPETSYPVGHVIGFIAATPDELLPLAEIESAIPSLKPAYAADTARPQWTKKAKILADRLGVDLPSLAAAHPGVVIGEDAVRTAAASLLQSAGNAIQEAGIKPKLDVLTGEKHVQRVMILGGGGGAALVLDILARTTNQQAVGILDNNSSLAGQSLMAVPILGNFDLAISLWHEGKFDALISTVVRDVADRESIFKKFSSLGIPFCNIIDPSVRIGGEARLGTGNLIVYGGYVATGVSLGNNNFLAAGTYIEHHSNIGSHCTFGPRTSLSGKVTVGDRVKFGTQVAVEPQLNIGADSLIASGVVLTSHVPPKSIVKNSITPVIRDGKR